MLRVPRESRTRFDTNRRLTPWASADSAIGFRQLRAPTQRGNAALRQQSSIQPRARGHLFVLAVDRATSTVKYHSAAEPVVALRSRGLAVIDLCALELVRIIHVHGFPLGEEINRGDGGFPVAVARLFCCA